MENNFIRVNFAESKIPIFKENKAKGFLTYGEDNSYPQMLINLYNSSPKHGAIVTQKAAYIAGDKTEIIGNNTEEIARANDYLANINAYEDFETLKNKVAQDLELFDGFALEIIWNKAKTSIAEMYHLPFQNLRVSLDGNFMYSEDWADRRAEVTKYFAWNPATRESKQVYYFKMYRAGCGEYPTAPYQSALKYIEIDTEIANFHLNSIKSGFSAQTLIQLFKGIPTPEEMRNTVKRFKDNFTGSENAGSVVLQFNEPNETPSVINNLAPTDFDKMFMQLNEQVQQEILMSHRVTSPMLFGIKTEGQLGGRSELIEAYEAFQTSYIEPRQNQMDRAFTSLFKYITPVKLVTKNKPPIGLDYQALFTAQIITNEEARKELGLPLISNVQRSSLNDSINALSPLVANNVLSNMTVNEKRQLANLPPIPGGDVLESPVAVQMAIDDEGTIKKSPKAPNSDTPNKDPKGEGTAKGDASNTRGAKVSERAEKILKEKSDEFNEKHKDKLGYGVNVGMLKSVFQRGLGAYNTSHSPKVSSAEQWALARVNAFLYIVKNGRPENPKYDTDYDLLPTDHPKKVEMCECNPFGWDDDTDLEVFALYGEDADKFTAVPMQFGLGLQAAILQWLYSNKGITLDVLANNINKSVEEIQAEVDIMVEDEIVRVVDGIIEVLPKGIRQLDDSNISTEIVTRYTYQKAPGISGGRVIPTSRDFCKRLVALNRVYTREDIDQISDVIGFDAWKRRGGWMTIKGSSPAAHVPYCRHIWQPQLFRRNL